MFFPLKPFMKVELLCVMLQGPREKGSEQQQDFFFKV